MSERGRMQCYQCCVCGGRKGGSVYGRALCRQCGSLLANRLEEIADHERIPQPIVFAWEVVWGDGRGWGRLPPSLVAEQSYLKATKRKFFNEALRDIGGRER